MDEATRYMEFVAELYAIQNAGGIYYLHENPAQATSWQLACIQRVCGLRGAQVVTMDQCMYGLQTPDGSGGMGLAKKPTKFVTQSPEIARELRRRRQGGHRHIPLLGGRAAAAAIYPR